MHAFKLIQNEQLLRLKFFRFFQTSSDKNYGKNCYLDNFVFLRLPSLNNVEKQWAKFASICIMGSQHCIGGERELRKICVNLCYGFATLYRGRGGIWTTLKNSHNILSLIVALGEEIIFHYEREASVRAL